MSNVQNLLLSDARDEQGGLVHAPDCDQHDCFVVQGKKQGTNTGGKTKMPDHYRCSITCAFCSKRKHYEDECYHKQRLPAKLKSEAQSAGGIAGGKGQGEKGEGKSEGRGKGQAEAQGKGGGRGGPDKKNQDSSGGNTAYVRKHGTSQAEHWMSWPTNTERTLKHRTTSSQEHVNKLRSMHRPREGLGPAYSIFPNFHNRNAPKPAQKSAPGQARPKPRTPPEGAGIPARHARRHNPAPKAAPAPRPPEPQAKPKPQVCPFCTVAERNAMHPERPERRRSTRGIRSHAQSTTKTVSMVPGQEKE